jgi:hypothetical protein
MHPKWNNIRVTKQVGYDQKRKPTVAWAGIRFKVEDTIGYATHSILMGLYDDVFG